MTVVKWLLDSDPGLRWRHATGGAPEPVRARRREQEYLLARRPSRQQPDGTWLRQYSRRSALHFSVEDGDGHPSRWKTLPALRVGNGHGGTIA